MAHLTLTSHCCHDDMSRPGRKRRFWNGCENFNPKRGWVWNKKLNNFYDTWVGFSRRIKRCSALVIVKSVFIIVISYLLLQRGWKLYLVESCCRSTTGENLSIMLTLARRFRARTYRSMLCDVDQHFPFVFVVFLFYIFIFSKQWTLWSKATKERCAYLRSRIRPFPITEVSIFNSKIFEWTGLTKKIPQINRLSQVESVKRLKRNSWFWELLTLDFYVYLLLKS